MVQQIQFLFELPVLLRNNLQKRQQRKQTMRHYDRTIDVFEIYSQVPTFQKIKKECEEIVLPIRNELKDRLQKIVNFNDER